jgi:hypothetical protein
MFVKGYKQTEEHKRRIGNANRGKIRTEQTKHNLSVSHLGHKVSEKTKKKIGFAVRQGLIDGTRKISHRTGYGRKTLYSDIWFRSRMEAKFAEWLDSKNIVWFYEPKRFKISIGSYLPDFYLPDKDIYIEVKGRHIGLDKVECFRKEYNVRVILADGDYFKKKGISKYD